MNTSAVIVTSIGSASSLFVVIGNIFLLYNTRRKKNDIVLFYFRFYVDVFFGLSYFLYSFLVLEFSFHGKSFFIESSSLFWFGLPFSNASAARNFLVLLIVLDRLLATCLPIKYHNIRPTIPNFYIFILPILFVGVEDFVFFVICGRHSEFIEDSCVAFPCSLNPCAYGWWTSYKTVIFPIIIVLTIALCIKLLMFSNRVQNSAVAKRANRLALLDAFLIFVFDCIPSVMAYQFPNSPLIQYTSAGPVTAMLKQIGRAIETFIVIDILVRRNVIEDSHRKSSQIVFIVGKQSKSFNCN
uniref:Serpentine Receptor, class BC (Class B-like) n=1 Tax=Caenorhabditis tropicalis TaxID=1561998 RepID=A0A1I7U1K8_9PELO